MAEWVTDEGYTMAWDECTPGHIVDLLYAHLAHADMS